MLKHNSLLAVLFAAGLLFAALPLSSPAYAEEEVEAVPVQASDEDAPPPAAAVVAKEKEELDSYPTSRARAIHMEDVPSSREEVQAPVQEEQDEDAPPPVHKPRKAAASTGGAVPVYSPAPVKAAEKPTPAKTEQKAAEVPPAPAPAAAAVAAPTPVTPPVAKVEPSAAAPAPAPVASTPVAPVAKAEEPSAAFGSEPVLRAMEPVPPSGATPPVPKLAQPVAAPSTAAPRAMDETIPAAPPVRENARREEEMPAPAAQPTSGRDYVLGSGDKLKITVFGEEDLSGQFEVSSTGMVSMPLIGQVKAIGNTTSRLESIIAAKLSEGYMKDPRVSVEVNNYRPFFIVGEVMKPGSYDYVNGMTVITAVALAGGYTYRADKDGLSVKHGGQNSPEAKAKEDSPVMPGDVIRVSERFF